MVTSEDLDFIKRDLRKWNLRPTDAAVFTGSRVEGFGNVNSDFDIYLFVSDSSKSFSAKRTSLIAGYLYIQYECFSFEQATQLAEKIRMLSDKPTIHHLDSVTLDEIDWYYRTAIGIPLTADRGQYAVLTPFQRNIACNVFDTWARLQSVRQLALADDLQKADNILRATLAAKASLEWALDSWLARQNEGFPSRKWRFEKMARTFGANSQIYISAWALKSPGGLQSKLYLERVRSLLADLDVRLDPDFDILAIAPKRQSDVSLFTLRSQSYLLKNNVHLYKIGPITQTIWESISNQAWDKDYIIAKIVKQTDLSDDQARRYLFALLDEMTLVEVIEWMS